MATLSESEFMARIGMRAQPLVLPTQETVDEPTSTSDQSTPGFESIEGPQGGEGALLPGSDATFGELAGGLATAQGGKPQRVPMAKGATPDFATRLGARPGIPFDTETGVSFMSRLRAAAQPTPVEEQKALEAAYGKGRVRRNSFGDLVVTKPNAEGRETDYLVDPIGLDAGDAASVLAQLPEIGGSILAAIKTRGVSMAPGIWNAAKTLAAAVAGSAIGGAAKDVAVRAAEGEPIQPSEIATRRGEQAAFDVGAGTLTGVAGKVGAQLFSPFSKAGPLQFDAKEAQKYFANKYGIKLPMSPAESTGNSFLQRAEAMESQKPGASVAFEKLYKEREDQLSRLQQIALGGGVPDEEAAGRRALDALGVKTAVLTKNVEDAALEAMTAAEAELKRGVGLPVRPEVVGKSIDAQAKALREAFNQANEANYSAVFNNPLAKQPIIEGKGLKAEIDALIDELPKVEQQVTRTTGLLGPTGKPITTTVPTDVPIATPVRPRLEELSAKLDGGKVSLNDLKQIRTDVDNAIKTGEAIPGVKEGRLKALYSKLTGAIEQGLDDIGDPDLKDAWQKATTYYRDNVGKFEKAGIAELFRDPINALGPHEIVEKAMSSPDVYNSYKEFFGAASPQIRGIQQAIRDETLGLSDISPTIGAAAFVKRLEALPKEIRADVFGADAGKLRAAAQALRAAGGETLPAAEMQEMLRSGNLSAAKIDTMLTMQRGKDAAYRNELVKAASEGTLAADKIKPTEFVNKLVFAKGTQPKDVEELVALLGDRPDVLEDIRRLTFQRALDDATTVNMATGRRVVAANDLEELLANKNMAKRLQTVLGASTFEDLSRLKDFLKPGAVVQQAAKSAGGLSTGQQVAGLVEKGALKYVDRAIKNFFIATVYTSPIAKAYISNTILKEQGKANVVNYLVASTPFLEAMAKLPTEGAQRRAMYSIKGSIDQYLRENPSEGATSQPEATKSTRDIPWDQFLQRIGASPDSN